MTVTNENLPRKLPAEGTLSPARKLSWCMEMTGLSQPSLWRMIQDNQFPKPFYPLPRSPRWVESEVLEWMDTKIAERDGAAA